MADWFSGPSGGAYNTLEIKVFMFVFNAGVEFQIFLTNKKGIFHTFGGVICKDGIEEWDDGVVCNDKTQNLFSRLERSLKSLHSSKFGFMDLIV